MRASLLLEAADVAWFPSGFVEQEQDIACDPSGESLLEPVGFGRTAAGNDEIDPVGSALGPCPGGKDDFTFRHARLSRLGVVLSPAARRCVSNARAFGSINSRRLGTGLTGRPSFKARQTLSVNLG